MLQVTLTGILGKDPDARYTPNGKMVTNMSVVVKRRNGKDMWVQVEAWERLAEVCNQYLQKGSRVLVNGEPRSDAYQSKDGEIRSSLRVVAHSVEFLSPQQNEDEPDEFSGYDGEEEDY
ncbi:MAG: single-stranded DNA-binding protein [Chloroflexota bacterium]|nr:MAG: single-stranded DNA-binding protein [Bellilinea sp.]